MNTPRQWYSGWWLPVPGVHWPQVPPDPGAAPQL